MNTTLAPVPPPTSSLSLMSLNAQGSVCDLCDSVDVLILVILQGSRDAMTVLLEATQAKRDFLITHKDHVNVAELPGSDAYELIWLEAVVPALVDEILWMRLRQPFARNEARLMAYRA